MARNIDPLKYANPGIKKSKTKMTNMSKPKPINKNKIAKVTKMNSRGR